MFSRSLKYRNAFLLLAVFVSLLIVKTAAGQCITQVRKYANTQQINAGILTSVTNAGNAADNSPETYSTISRLVGVGNLITVTQYLKFDNTIAAGVPVNIKASFPTSILSLLAGVEIQPFTNLHNDITTLGTWQADADGAATSNAALLGLLNGAGDMEITITPKTSGGTNVAYDGVWIKLSGVAIGQSLDVFHAYILEDAPAAIGCTIPVDVLAGVRAGSVVGGIANATGTVSNKWNAIDNDPTLSTYASMDVGAQVLSEVYHTTIFNSTSQPSDVVRMVLQNPGGGLLDLNVLTGFTIQPYNGSVAAGPSIASNSGLLSLSLLPGTAGNEKYQLDIAVPVAYDRVEIKMGGVAAVGLVPGLRIYDVKRLIAPPAINMDGAAVVSKTVCQGNTAVLMVTNAQNCTTYKWYDAAVGGNLLQTGTTYTPPAAGLSATNNFYIEATRTGCTEASTRTKVTLNVDPLPGITPSSVNNTCSGVATYGINYTGANSPVTYSVTWDAAALSAGFTNVTDAALPATKFDVNVPATASTAIYHGNITVKNANGCASNATPFSVNVDAVPTQPIVNLTP